MNKEVLHYCDQYQHNPLPMKVRSLWRYFWVRKKYRQIFLCDYCGEIRKMCSICGEIKNIYAKNLGRLTYQDMTTLNFGIFTCHDCNHKKLVQMAEMWEKRKG